MPEENLTDISALYDAVDSDPNEHVIKELAALLITAMNDWPTMNQTSIKEFTDELYLFYGSPISIEKIKNKKIDFGIPNNSWRSEAGASIVEMILIASKSLNIDDFDLILKTIITYYSNKKNENIQ